MTNIHLSYPEVEEQARLLDLGREDINTQLATLRSQVETLISNGFVTDQASGAFGESYQRFTTGATATIEGLVGMTQFLYNTATAMADLDRQLAAAIR
jgi:uncharacterized protein YukE